MTTLKTFQAEIEAFSHDKQREAIHKAREQHHAAELARHHGKLPAKKEPKEPIIEVKVDEEEQPEVPLEDLVISEGSSDELQSRLALYLLKGHGEYLIALGAHPDPVSQYNTSQTESASTVGRELTSESLSTSIGRLRAACRALQAELIELYKVEDAYRKEGPYGCWLIRLTPRGVEEIMEVRVAVVGNVDAGKSTTLGVLTRGGLDDGRGKARVALFRHPHEVETGRTSSILGFSPQGDSVIPSTHITDSSDPHHPLSIAKREKLGWEDICKRAAKVVSFIDLAGHERYFKTTLYGLSGCAPDYVMLMVGGNAGLIGMSKEHLGVALALNVPIAVCVTKIDMTPPNILEQTVNMLTKVLKSPGCRRVPVFVNSPQEAVDCARYLGKPLDSSSTAGRLCPIFMVSNVTGHNLPLLRTFLNCLPSSQSDDKYVVDAPFEFQISDTFSVPFVGTVVSGVITSGTIHANDPVLLGPDSVGQFIPTAVKTIQRKRASVTSGEAGQSVSFALKRIRRSQVRKGMVLIAKTDTPPKAVKRFEGMVMVLHHSSTIQPNYQAMMHCGAIRQTVRIKSLDHPSGLIRTGDRAKVVFEFINQSEFVKEGQLILLREAKTKVLGVVTKILG
ncbi:GTP-binding protein 1 [Cryptococcus deuterogattii LA55]|uniref:GTP-binding protein 1 n=1 Tax=Cryptococcus deuterogattii Ram5 TaxID=1296110 RepID=A0A0D0UYD6_9TREE|nr:GTP-binding protein 1 [Cryptococcus deuterogattii LA55]KIR32877.1 GTP-binding protein 1 [Cryptococcus deuterogattii MMRL2647]KIR39194.1 GTP-binding protein 1 [Cryptococcus deuterogattii Ram5]KIR71204.1 GTP-binding protein 1 [Cryptococcus deuterogattii CA1014]KIR94616.1 GTP-binding protein 1 [Cryptococcus deuterogattii CBS 10090]KIS00859.1 GTP-binding protein 1 [Cryptococcus deuterogattii 2001/935-1]